MSARVFLIMIFVCKLTHEPTHTKTRCDTTAVIHAVHSNKNISDCFTFFNMPGIDIYANILLLYASSEANRNTNSNLKTKCEPIKPLKLCIFIF